MNEMQHALRFDYTQHCLRADRRNFKPLTFEQFVQLVAQIKEL
jgi:hypothetical protein